MKLHPRVSRAALDLVKRLDPLRAEAEPHPGGGWVVGHGHRLTARQGARVDADDAEALLRFDLSNAARTLDAALKKEVSDAQFEALTSLAFDVGPQAFAASPVVRWINAGDAGQAAAALELWRLDAHQHDAAARDAWLRRRAAETSHFLGPEAAPHPAPAPVAAEPARSALTAAADALRAKLDLILAEPEPPAHPTPLRQPAAPPPPPALPDHPQAAPVLPEVELEPAPTLPIFAPPEPVPPTEPEPPPLIASPPELAAPPTAPSEPEPAAEPFPSLPRPAAARGETPEAATPAPAGFGRLLDEEAAPPDLEPRRDWLKTEGGGRLRPLWRRLIDNPLVLVALGAAGLVVFACALVGMLLGQPTTAGLLLGALGVAAMAPAAGLLLFRFTGRGGG